MKTRQRQWAAIKQLRQAVAGLSIEQRRRAKKLLPPSDRTATTQPDRVSAGIDPKAAAKSWVRFNLAEWLEGVGPAGTTNLDR